jgi:hypothetical protein
MNIRTSDPGRLPLVRLLWLICALMVGGWAHAEGALDGELEVLKASAAFNEGVVELNAHVRYPLTERLREALLDGVTLVFDLEIGVNRERRYWFDAGIISLNLRRELSYHVISDRYVLRDSEDVEQASFPTLEVALEQLGQIQNLPIAVEAQMRGDGPWAVGLRAGVRRGRMPDALRALVFWSDDWHRTSEWYTWTLKR